MEECRLYKKEKGNKVRCLACSHRCRVLEGNTGICGVRINSKGKLYLLVYGKICAEHVDPIEKKPLYHFLPGSFTYSIGTVGCNFKCDWCQNFDISQASKTEFGKMIFGKEVKAKEIVQEAIRTGCKSIAYTYNEPVIAVEFYKEIAEIAKIKKLKNILVTNGYFTKESLQYFRGLIDAANVDLKSFSDETYRKFCGAKLSPVLETIKEMHKMKIHLEITTLIVPGVNDSTLELEKIAGFIFSIDKKGEIPWHISRFFPRYKMQDNEITPFSKLEEAKQIGLRAGLKYIHLGNV